MEYGSSRWIHLVFESLRLELFAYKRLREKLLIQLYVQPENLRKTLACLVVGYVQSLQRRFWHLSNALKLLARDVSCNSAQSTLAALSQPLYESLDWKLWKRCCFLLHEVFQHYGHPAIITSKGLTKYAQKELERTSGEYPCKVIDLNIDQEPSEAGEALAEALANYAAKMFGQQVAIVLTSLPARTRHLVELENSMAMLEHLITLAPPVNIQLSIFVSCNILLKQLAAAIIHPKSRPGSSVYSLAGVPALPAATKPELASVVQMVLRLLADTACHLQEQHYARQLGDDDYDPKQACFDSTELAVPEMKSLLEHDLIPEMSSLGDTLIKLLSATFVRWHWQPFMQIYGMLGLCSGKLIQQEDCLKLIRPHLALALTDMASSSEGIPRSYLCPYRAIWAGNAPPVFAPHSATICKIMYFTALGKVLAQSPKCEMGEKWRWQEEFSEMVAYMHVANWRALSALPDCVCIEFLSQAEDFYIAAEMMESELMNRLLATYVQYIVGSACSLSAMKTAEKALLNRGLFLRFITLKCDEAYQQSRGQLEGPARQYVEFHIELAVSLFGKVKETGMNWQDDECRIFIDTLMWALQTMKICEQKGVLPIASPQQQDMLMRLGLNLYWFSRVKLWYHGLLSQQECSQMDEEVGAFLCSWMSPIQIAAENLPGFEHIHALMTMTHSTLQKAKFSFAETWQPESGDTLEYIHGMTDVCRAAAEFWNWDSFVIVREEHARLKAQSTAKPSESSAPNGRQRKQKIAPSTAASTQTEEDSAYVFPQHKRMPRWWEYGQKLSDGWAVGKAQNSDSTGLRNAVESTDTAESPTRSAVNDGSASAASVTTETCRDGGIQSQELEIIEIVTKNAAKLKDLPAVPTLQAVWNRVLAARRQHGCLADESAPVEQSLLRNMIRHGIEGPSLRLSGFMYLMRTKITAKEYQSAGYLLNLLECGAFMMQMASLLSTVLAKEVRKDRISSGLSRISMSPFVEFSFWKSIAGTAVAPGLSRRAMDKWMQLACDSMKNHLPAGSEKESASATLTNLLASMTGIFQDKTQLTLQQGCELLPWQSGHKAPLLTSTGAHESTNTSFGMPQNNRVDPQRQETPALARMRRRLQAQKEKQAKSMEADVSELETQLADKLAMELMMEESKEKDRLVKAAAKRKKKKDKRHKQLEKTDELGEGCPPDTIKADSKADIVSDSSTTLKQEEPQSIITPDVEAATVPDPSPSQQNSCIRPVLKEFPQQPASASQLARDDTGTSDLITDGRDSSPSATASANVQQAKAISQKVATASLPAPDRGTIAERADALPASSSHKQAKRRGLQQHSPHRPVPPTRTVVHPQQQIMAGGSPASRANAAAPKALIKNGDCNVRQLAEDSTIDPRQNKRKTRQPFTKDGVPSETKQENARPSRPSPIWPAPRSARPLDTQLPESENAAGSPPEPAAQDSKPEAQPLARLSDQGIAYIPPRRAVLSNTAVTPASTHELPCQETKAGPVPSPSLSTGSEDIQRLVQPCSDQTKQLKDSQSRLDQKPKEGAQLLESPTSQDREAKAAASKTDTDRLHQAQLIRQVKLAQLEEFCLCPITQEVMVDPVVAKDGYTYERKAIADWLKAHNTSPMTNQELSSKELSSNRILKQMIQAALL